MVGGGDSYWERLPPYLQVLSNRTAAADSLKKTGGIIDYCEKYAGTEQININYKLNSPEINTESPLKVFNENSNNYNDLEDGIYNFILCWDKPKGGKYVLATSFFNPYEYGSKHAMMSYRLGDTVSSDFIFSGEFKKNGANELLFHDTSSLYFFGINFKKSMSKIYLYDTILPKYTPEELKQPEIISKIKAEIFETFGGYMYNNPKSDLRGLKTIEEIKKFFDGDNIPIHDAYPSLMTTYKTHLENIVKDAFNRIFSINIQPRFINEFSIADYGSQKDENKFLATLCAYDPQKAFNIYANDIDCEGKLTTPPIKTSCTLPK